MRAVRGIAAAILVAALLGGVAASALADHGGSPGIADNGNCAEGDSGKLGPAGTTVTITAPAGKLITGYCVKSANEIVNTTITPSASVTITSPATNQNGQLQEISHYSYNWDDAPPVEITGTVVFTNPTCENPGGAGFTASGEGYTGALTSGTVGPGNTITVTLTANPGFVLVGQTVFTHTFSSLANCEEQPIPLLTGATFIEATCTTGPAFQFVRTFLPGIGNRPFYLVEGPLVDGKPVAGASYTITAQPVEGYVLTGQTVWTHTFAAAPTNCGSTSPPPPPPPRVCPDGLPPTPGEGAFDPNDDCKRPPAPPTPPVTTTTPPVAPAATPPPPPPPAAVTPPAAKPPVAKPKPVSKPKAAKPKATPKPDKPPAKKLTGDPKKDDCKKMKNGLLNCGGTTVVPGSG